MVRENEIREAKVAIQMPAESHVLSEAAAVPGWHRGLCVIALLVTRTSGARSHRTLLTNATHSGH